MGIDPRAAGYEAVDYGARCLSCHLALTQEWVSRLEKSCVELLRQWEQALDELVDRTFELVKRALIASRGKAVLEPGEIERLCPEQVQAYQHAWEAAKAIIEQPDKPVAERYRPPEDASEFKDLAASFQLWPPPPDNPQSREVYERSVTRGTTHLCIIRPVPWLDQNNQTDLFELAKRAALGAHSAKAVRCLAAEHDRRLSYSGETPEAARNIGIERHKAAPTLAADAWTNLQLTPEERHVRVLFTGLLERNKFTASELTRCRASEDYLAERILPAFMLQLYRQGPRRDLLARMLFTWGEFTAYQQDPKAWHLGEVFEKKLAQFRACQDRWDSLEQAEADRMRVGKHRRSKGTHS